ncbi:glycosyltransferase family 2 protein [Rhodovulum euryhalinum]|uniref:Glycosyl transferase family 2 n=1 Tax=Rhodovulum euryhalinum TaxID=35805 RepID=A0A4R2KN71_9RHOB|nr:glycosyltransferase family 2 protein [Rhodovulum euryhalinum]TCO74007.1 glycosyl transferase family 2 [Rhodovulum euryhalinum]
MPVPPETEPRMIRRSLRARRLGQRLCLDAVARREGAGRAVWLVFPVGTPPAAFGPAAASTIRDIRSIGGGLVVGVAVPGDAGPVVLRIDGQEAAIEPRAAETALFAGLATLVALRNGETVEQTGAWLEYHVRAHGAEAALILDRSPGGDGAYADALEGVAAGIPGLQRLVLVDLDQPLGKPGLPPESHPFNAAEAPGKDRMDLPPPDPWTAPPGELQLYEWLRHAFLDEARAVANIELYDLLAPADGPSVFDRAAAAPSGTLSLIGRHAFPWRPRDPDAPGFADHLCVQFDTPRTARRWCVAPACAGADAVWRMVRIVGTGPRPEDTAPFYRCMGLRHHGHPVSQIVPKTSLVEDPALLMLAETWFGKAPVRIPEIAPPRIDPAATRTAIVTTMKNEGPFILDWLAYHRAIGVDDFLIYTNDCTDGTDTMLNLLQAKGLVQHRDNPYRGMGLKPQHAALQAAEAEPLIRGADWLICMDVDEYINIRTGDGTLNALFAAVADANMVSCTWRLFGNSDIHDFADTPVIAQFTRCAPEMTRKPHQAWGFKTLFRNIGLFRKLGVHRPKGLNPQLWDRIAWVNGSGAPMPPGMYRNAWRSTAATVGYDLVQLNHYAVRSAESFLVKRDRGRVNHVDRDQGLAYWFRMNNNAEEDLSIQRMIPAMQAERARLLADPGIAAAHSACVAAHRARIDELKARPDQAAFLAELTGWRMERLSLMHRHFGANVFLAGPECIPDEVVRADPAPDFLFTVDRGETAH